MPRGVWKEGGIAKRSAAARKGAKGRAKRAALRTATREECDATRGSQAHKALAGAEISALIERLRARGTPEDVSRGTEAAE